MTESSLHSSVRNSSLAPAHHPIAASLVTLAAAVLLVPLAGWQFGAIGAAVVAVLAVTVVVSEWLSAWCSERFTRANRTAASLLAASGIRMALPLAAVLVIVVRFRESVPVESVLYVVPLYLAMLLTDVACGWRGSAAEDKE